MKVLALLLLASIACPIAVNGAKSYKPTGETGHQLVETKNRYQCLSNGNLESDSILDTTPKAEDFVDGHKFEVKIHYNGDQRSKKGETDTDGSNSSGEGRGSMFKRKKNRERGKNNRYSQKNDRFNNDHSKSTTVAGVTYNQVTVNVSDNNQPVHLNLSPGHLENQGRRSCLGEVKRVCALLFFKKPLYAMLLTNAVSAILTGMPIYMYMQSQKETIQMAVNGLEQHISNQSAQIRDEVQKCQETIRDIRSRVDNVQKAGLSNLKYIERTLLDSIEKYGEQTAGDLKDLKLDQARSLARIDEFAQLVQDMKPELDFIIGEIRKSNLSLANTLISLQSSIADLKDHQVDMAYGIVNSMDKRLTGTLNQLMTTQPMKTIHEAASIIIRARNAVMGNT